MWVIIISRMVTTGGEGSQVDTWGKSVTGERTVSAKALGYLPCLRNKEASVAGGE